MRIDRLRRLAIAATAAAACCGGTGSGSLTAVPAWTEQWQQRAITWSAITWREKGRALVAAALIAAIDPRQKERIAGARRRLGAGNGGWRNTRRGQTGRLRPECIEQFLATAARRQPHEWRPPCRPPCEAAASKAPASEARASEAPARRPPANEPPGSEAPARQGTRTGKLCTDPWQLCLDHGTERTPTATPSTQGNEE